MNGKPDETRPPTIDDLVGLARALNEQGALYIVIGGMAVMHQGLARHTEDIDLLYETSLENQRKIRAVLAQLPDRAILEIDESENWADIGVIRVNDVVTIDLMPSACGVDFQAAKDRIEIHEVHGVAVPFASAALLLETKRTWREKDQIDSAFLRAEIERRKKTT